MDKVARYREKKQYESLKHLSHRDWQPYTPKEEALVLDRSVNLVTIARTLGRSYRAVQEKRKKMRRLSRQIGG